jgi:hypothetical protein
MDLFRSRQSAGVEQISRIKEWVATQFDLGPDAVVMVSEVRCSEPGCPPLETIIAVLEGCGDRRQAKLHKAVQEIDANDIAGITFGP